MTQEHINPGIAASLPTTAGPQRGLEEPGAGSSTGGQGSRDER